MPRHPIRYDGAPSRGTDRTEPLDVLPVGAGMTLFVGGLIALMGAAHLEGVIQTAMTRGYAYNFRLAGLLLIGIIAREAACYASPLCVASLGVIELPGAARWRHHPAPPRLGAEHSLQPDMAPGLSVLAAVNLIVLVAAWRRLGTVTRPLPTLSRRWCPLGAGTPRCESAVVREESSGGSRVPLQPLR